MRDQMEVKRLVGWNELIPLPNLPIHFSMICLIWNCKGACNNVFKRNMSELIFTHNPDVLVLVETKVPLSTLNDFFSKKGFTTNSFSDPVGCSGGVWVLWNPSNVTVSAVEVTNQATDATISRVDYEEWIFTAVYGSSNPSCRDLMWYDLQERANNDSKARLLTGDFNDHAESSKKRSFQRGAHFLNSCNFIDFGV
ncbi:hypothetical protein Vadar_033650 [Vaccinium darrowii]|uniref:Uncharacterized protein n=1 Tax=Vaccinium darrowii TaxID=229202 RepID=A0ACB7YJ04_9ERIC|nr:hypothetical protein Vadar_033650 [Vaccinium darrowii]